MPCSPEGVSGGRGGPEGVSGCLVVPAGVSGCRVGSEGVSGCLVGPEGVSGALGVLKVSRGAIDTNLRRHKFQTVFSEKNAFPWQAPVISIHTYIFLKIMR